MTSQTYETVNKAWKQTCKVIFGEEIGELKEYEDWLWKYNKSEWAKRKSASGKDVYTSIKHYCGKARFMSLDDLDFSKKYAPLGINEIKDIDSIVEALQERFVYTGNIVLGNSKDVDGSSDIHNSFHVLDCSIANDCEYVAYSYISRNAKYMFGCSTTGASQFMIGCHNSTASARCLDSWSAYCADLYFCFNCDNVQDAMFSFGLKNKRNAIGNLELPRDRYAELKKKLVAEMAVDLKGRKSLPSLIDMVSGDGRKPDIDRSIFDNAEEEQDMKPMEEAFSETTGIILGKRLVGIDKYGKWLGRYATPIEILKSAMTGRKVYHGSLSPPYAQFPKDRLVKERESRKIAEAMRLGEGEIKSVKSIMGSMWKIAFFTTEFRIKENRNLVDAPGGYSCVNCYRGIYWGNNENAAFCSATRDSKYMFGCNVTFYSSFCIRGNYSSNLSRVLEADCCRDCTDIYYSHNCENVHDSMFCFNVKNLRNAIGNGVLPLEKYKAVKKSLLEQIVSELEKKKDLKWDIYNIGCAK
jgi:hypothetical protein